MWSIQEQNLESVWSDLFLVLYINVIQTGGISGPQSVVGYSSIQHLSDMLRFIYVGMIKFL